MKRIILFFAVCLGLSVSQTTFADNADAVRTASKRTSTQVSSQQTTGRAVSTNTKRSSNTQNSSKNSRTAAQPQQQVVSRTTAQQNVKPRENTTTASANISATSRKSALRSVNSRQNELKKTPEKAKTARTRTPVQTIKHISRATDINKEKITTIKSMNYSKCKTVYYECMDEFCANKDANLRRCACSSRIHEFDDIKKQLSNAEDKMLDFNQRLLTVNLDKEDAAAISVATEGEKGYVTKDTSTSESILQKITQSLNNSGDSKINNNLSAISLSLDVDSAWDNVDSMSGVATSAKSGVDLYNAANPVCIEMAKEVCSDEELNIAKDGYKLTIQQDCDTVAKSYKTQYSNALEKIHESGALLDMSRLNVYQQKNSDDTLTCKKKILNQLSDTSVCGADLYKCLDMTGQYIDPSTGSAFLSENLSELSNLLQEPSNGERWSKVQHNDSFIKYLNSKKKFLETATKQCQDIADMVWQDFLDDALAQIKLAQNAKIEEIRQSCTTLVTQCKTKAEQSLSDFDARALSTFNVASDKTVNKMCSEIETACSGLMGDNGIAALWQEGMTGISTDITYQKIIDTCTSVGRECIVRQCDGTSGNFALCQDTTDNNRRAILNHEVCWNEVLNCVKSADNLANMTVMTHDEYLKSLYGMLNRSTQNYDDPNILEVEDAPNPCGNNPTKACLITEQIWGTCEYSPNSYTITDLITESGYIKSNKILTPNSGSSLLSWFATNTGTADALDSCSSIGCPFNYEMLGGKCQLIANLGTTAECRRPKNQKNLVTVTDSIKNYCQFGNRDIYGNCCDDAGQNAGESALDNGICVPKYAHAVRLWNLTCTKTDDYLCPTTGKLALYCITQSSAEQPIVYDKGKNEYACGLMPDGESFDQTALWIIVDENGRYYSADKDRANSYPRPVMKYNQRIAMYCPANPTGTNNISITCTYKYKYNTNTETYEWHWEPINASTPCEDVPTTINNEFLINYVYPNNN